MNRRERRLATPHLGKKTVDANRFSGPGLGLNAHWRVAKVAVALAEELWEVYARSNAFYHRMLADGRVTEKDARRLFVERVAPRMLEDARQALTDCLTQPDSVMPQAQKDEIAEALILDNSFRGKREVAERFSDISRAVH